MGNTPQALEAFLAPLVDAGIDMFHCSQRRFWTPEFEGSDLNLAGWTKKLTGKPTITVGSVTLEIRTEVVSWGHEKRLRLDSPAGRRERTDSNLIRLVARGFAARDELLSMSTEQVSATPVTTLRHTERIARLAYLAPDIVRAILDGRQPKRVTARYLSRLGSLPLCWTEQRAMLGFAAP